MTLRSMTGFGRGEARDDRLRVEVESKSFNRKRLDTRLHLPDALASLEPEIVELIKDRCRRGRVEVSVDVEARAGEGAAANWIDPDRFEAVYLQLQKLAEETDLEAVSLSDVLTFRDALEPSYAADPEQQGDLVLEAVEASLDRLIDARSSEGEGLGSDLLEYLDSMDADLQVYRQQAPVALEAMRERIIERVRETLDDMEAGQPDEQRLAEEVVFHVDRADVSEELQRAGAHIESLRELIRDSEPGAAVGKEIDFYLQELVRETNTLSSKSHTAELTDLAISMKSTVEKMREQAANIE
jgi:uncharacterized protein (TIGR00255 family)